MIAAWQPFLFRRPITTAAKIENDLGDFQQRMAGRILVFSPFGRIGFVRRGEYESCHAGIFQRIADYHPGTANMIGRRYYQYGDAPPVEQVSDRRCFVRGNQGGLRENA